MLVNTALSLVIVMTDGVFDVRVSIRMSCKKSDKMIIHDN